MSHTNFTHISLSNHKVSKNTGAPPATPRSDSEAEGGFDSALDQAKVAIEGTNNATKPAALSGKSLPLAAKNTNQNASDTSANNGPQSDSADASDANAAATKEQKPKEDKTEVSDLTAALALLPPHIISMILGKRTVSTEKPLDAAADNATDASKPNLSLAVDNTAQKPAVDLTLAISVPTISAPTVSASTVSTQVADQSAINPNIGPQLAISPLSTATDNPGTLEGAEATSVTPTSISATNQAPQMKLTVDNAEATEQVMAGAAPIPSTVPSTADAKSAETLIPTNPTNLTKPTTPATEFLGNNPLFHRDATRLMAIANANQPLKELSSDNEKIDRKSSLEAALNTNSPITVSRLSNDAINAINAKIAGFVPNIAAYNRPERFSIATTINTDQAPEISPLPSALSPLSSAIDAADKNDLLLRNSSLESTANTSTLTASASQSTANQVTTIDLSSSTPNHEQSMSDAYFRRSEQYQQIANQMAEAVGQRLSAQIARGAWSMTIQLSPAHLGKIDIQLHMREGKQLEADFTTTNKNARDLILQGMNKLKDSLEESGISMGRMNVGQDARGSNQSNANSGEPQSQQQPTFRATKSNRNNTSADDSTTITPSPRKPDPSIGNLDVMV